MSTVGELVPTFHIGEFLRLLRELAPDEEHLYTGGKRSGRNDRENEVKDSRK
jgi:hypothetical protein